MGRLKEKFKFDGTVENNLFNNALKQYLCDFFITRENTNFAGIIWCIEWNR